jgi:hypothetical protein
LAAAPSADVSLNRNVAATNFAWTRGVAFSGSVAVARSGVSDRFSTLTIRRSSLVFLKNFAT